MWLLLALACTQDSDWHDLRNDRHDDFPRLDEGDEETDDGERPDTGVPEIPSDTSGPSDDTGDPDDTDQPPDQPQVCYPGPSGSWNICVDLVDYSSSWGSDYGYPDPYGGSAQYAHPVRFVDLYAADEDLGIATNFVLNEVMSWWKGQYGIFQSHVVEHLQHLRDASGGSITVNSGFRSPGYNGSVGGVTHSRHMYGDAADMVPSGTSLSGLADLCYAEGAGYVGMYSSFVHCDWRDDTLDPAFFDSSRSGEPPPLPVHTAHIQRGADGSYTAPATGFDEGEPYRLWRAWDDTGKRLDEHVGASFSAPLGTARVHVEVGGQVVVEVALEGR